MQVKQVLQELHHKVQLDLFSLKSSRLALCYPDLLLPQQWHPEVLQDTLHHYKVRHTCQLVILHSMLASKHLLLPAGGGCSVWQAAVSV